MMREEKTRAQAARAFLDPDLDELRLYLVPGSGEPIQIAPDYLTRNRRGARVIDLRTITHGRAAGFAPVTTALWIVLSDGREILAQSTRFWSHIALHGSPALQRLSDTMQLVKLQGKRG